MSRSVQPSPREGDHRVHVIDVGKYTLTIGPAFDLDFDTAFPTGPSRPHGLAMR